MVTLSSDASLNISKSSKYGETGLFTGIKFMVDGKESDVYNIIDWSSRRQMRVWYSSYGAEVLNCTEAVNRGYTMKLIIGYLIPRSAFRNALNVDSKGLFATVTTMNEGSDYRLRNTVQRILECLVSGGERNKMDTRNCEHLRRPNQSKPTSKRILMRILSNGKWEIPKLDTIAVESGRLL